MTDGASPSESGQVPPVESTPRLIGASFELLNRSSEEMRRASFYVGLIILGTVGPFALASWALEVVSIHMTNAQMRATLDDLVIGKGIPLKFPPTTRPRSDVALNVNRRWEELGIQPTEAAIRVTL